jgi:dethiobiotin synthetase
MIDTIFITGTGTGVGKSFLTSMLLYHMRSIGINTLVMKPFCAGGEDDINLYYHLLKGILPKKEITPFLFNKPVAPYAASKEDSIQVNLHTVCESVQRMSSKCECLLIEGIGGVCVPLSKGLLVADVIESVSDNEILVAPNRLGVLNDVILSSTYLQEKTHRKPIVVLMDVMEKDTSSTTNLSILKELEVGLEVINMPFLGDFLLNSEQIIKRCKKLEKDLVRLLSCVKLSSLSGKTTKAKLD